MSAGDRYVAPAQNGDRLNAVDTLSLLAVLLLAAVVARFRRELGGDALWLLGFLLSLLVFVLLASFLAARRSAWRVVHDFAPIVVLPVLFNTLGPVIHCTSPVQWDPVFGQIDALIFGELADRWRDVLGRPAWLTDLTYLAYLSYYVAPVLLGGILYRRGADNGFRTVVFTLALTFYASYVGYFIFPTLGPRVPRSEEAAVIGGGAISHVVRLFLYNAEYTLTDAFPSGHTAIALLCLYFAWQVSSAVFVLFVPIVIGIIFSTVYLHYHYVVDVLAGGGLAVACGWLGPRLEPVFEPREVVRRFALRLGIR